MQKLEARASFVKTKVRPLGISRSNLESQFSRRKRDTNQCAAQPTSHAHLDAHEFLGPPAGLGYFFRNGLAQAVTLFYELVRATDLTELVLQSRQSFGGLERLDWRLTEICADLSETALSMTRQPARATWC